MTTVPVLRVIGIYRWVLAAAMAAASCGDPGDVSDLGGSCESASGCSTRFCAQAPDADQLVCSQCGQDSDCPGPDEVCEWSESEGARLCVSLAIPPPVEPPPVEEPTPVEDRVGWNEDTCQMDDDGSSAEPGGLEVRSIVLVEDSTEGAHDGTTLYYPAVVETSRCTFKVIGWGNGSTGSGGAHYPAYFDHLASHGFVVAVAHTNRTTAESRPILTSVELAMAENADPSSVFYQKLDAEFGLIGKSLGAIAVAREMSDEGAVAGVLIGSGSGAETALTKPGLFATGDEDYLRQPVRAAYDAASGEAIYAQAAQEEGGFADGHFDLDDREGLIELSTSFMRCHLRESAPACSYIRCEDCQVEPWSVYQTKSAGSPSEGGNPGGGGGNPGGGSDDYEEQPIEATYSVNGAFETSEEVGEVYTLYYPTEMTGGHSVITWGNGAGGSPAMYAGLLRHFASWGFVVVATNSSTCRGEDLVGGIDLMASLNDDPTSVFHNQLDLQDVAASGHSLGGGCAVGAANSDARIKTVAIGNPAPGDPDTTDGSLLIMGAAGDPIVSPQLAGRTFEASEIPTVFGISDGGSHFVYTANGGIYRGYATAFFMSEVRDDSGAREAFYGPCELCVHPSWTVQRKNIP